MKAFQLVAFLLLLTCIGCDKPLYNISDPSQNSCECGSLENSRLGMRGALLASRFTSLQEFKSLVQIQYDLVDDSIKRVRVKHCSSGQEVTSILESGIAQPSITYVRDSGDFFDCVGLVANAPFAVANRKDLCKVYILARWRPDLFGEGDAAFFDLAKSAVNKINTKNLAYKTARDSTEKGYINTFNHITAQAFITSCFSEEIADFLGDVHERYNMPQLITGEFTNTQLSDTVNNPVDNYVDLINNEWGQEIGKRLRKKFSIDMDTYWTPELLSNYLNEIQSCYRWAFQIGMDPFKPEDELVVRFSDKINKVMRGVGVTNLSLNSHKFF
jgi:hypothetical protein